MSRDLAPANEAASLERMVRLAILAEFDFPSGFVRVWTGPADVTVFGQVFTAVGLLGSITPAKETTDLAPQKVTYSLSGLNDAVLSVLATEKFRGRACRHWLGFPNADWDGFDAEPIEMFWGKMDKAPFRDGPGAALSLTAESDFADLTRPRVVRYTHEQQVERFPGDLGCEFVAQVPDRQFAFGFALPNGMPAPGGPNPRPPRTRQPN